MSNVYKPGLEALKPVLKPILNTGINRYKTKIKIEIKIKTGKIYNDNQKLKSKPENVKSILSLGVNYRKFYLTRKSYLSLSESLTFSALYLHIHT